MSFQNQLLSLSESNTKHLSQLKQVVVRSLLQVAVKAVEKQYIEEGILEIISKDFNLLQTFIDDGYAIIFLVLRLYSRSIYGIIKPVEFKQCLKDLKFSEECIQDIFLIISGSKSLELRQNFSNKNKLLPHLVSYNWRVDIIVTSSFMTKILEPYVMMEWILSNGKIYTMEITLFCFHKLRHAVAKLLFEIQHLEVYNVVKSNI